MSTGLESKPFCQLCHSFVAVMLGRLQGFAHIVQAALHLIFFFLLLLFLQSA